MYDITPQDRTDMQGMILYGYARQKVSCYVFFKINDTTKFKKWLSDTKFQNAEKSPEKSCLNIAFTAIGMKKLVPDARMVSKENGFDQSFVEGMDTDHRNRILGDYDLNDPTQWQWGNRKDHETHGVLMVYALNEADLDEVYRSQVEPHEEAFAVRYKTNSVKHPTEKEHFGFTDGISQPVLKGLERSSDMNNFINPGEIVLGHLNAYDKHPQSPSIDGVEIGKNGTYMVVRDMRQDVKAFWAYMLKAGVDPVRIASKMVGRWPNGIPLTMAASEAEAIQLKLEKEKTMTRRDFGAFLNEFQYFESDKNGLKCPIGAHIRRGNPKDIKNENPDNPNEVSNKHRILRRGRPYGPFLTDTMEVETLIEAAKKEEHDMNERGLMFVCFNSDIERQFEFIQQTWINNRTFVGLYDEVDPIIGVSGKLDKASNEMKMKPTNFTEPACPFRNKYSDIPAFVQVKAGGYFFFPSISTLHYLSK